jgi:hypothetical protein
MDSYAFLLCGFGFTYMTFNKSPPPKNKQKIVKIIYKSCLRNIYLLGLIDLPIIIALSDGAQELVGFDIVEVDGAGGEAGPLLDGLWSQAVGHLVLLPVRAARHYQTAYTRLSLRLPSIDRFKTDLQSYKSQGLFINYVRNLGGGGGDSKV